MVVQIRWDGEFCALKGALRRFLHFTCVAGQIVCVMFMINAYAVFVLCKPTFSWQRSSNGRKTLFKSLMFDGCPEHECIFIHRVQDSKETRSPDNVVLNPPTQHVMMKRIVMTWWWWWLHGDDDDDMVMMMMTWWWWWWQGDDKVMMTMTRKEEEDDEDHYDFAKCTTILPPGY